MAEFNKRTDSVDVTQIMERVREGIRAQRGRGDADRQARELAAAALERCLEPLRTGSALIERNRGLAPPGRFDRDPEGGSLAPEAFEFDENTVYVSSRGTMGKLLYLVRKLLNPILRLFFNPDPIILAMMRQAEINSRLLDLLDRVNAEFERTGRKFAAREEIDALNYEVVNNLVVEMTRLAVDMKNHKMLVESVAGRLDFDERRAQGLESVTQARSTPRAGDAEGAEGAEGEGAAGGPTRSRRRRRRGRRRAGSGAGANAEASGEAAAGDGGNEGGATGPPVEAAGTAAAPERGADAAATPDEAAPERGADAAATPDEAAPERGADAAATPDEAAPERGADAAATPDEAAPERGADAAATPDDSESPAGAPGPPAAGGPPPPSPAERTRPDPPPDDPGDR